MPASAALNNFTASLNGARVLLAFEGASSAPSSDQRFTDSVVLSASIAYGVGCWEGYLESVVREFVAKVRVQSHRRAWTLITQYEVLVDIKAKELNTPNWERARDFVLELIGVDVYSSWIWAPKFSSQQDTKAFFDGVMHMRHAFSHGFPAPASVPGLSTSGKLDGAYASAAIDCLEFFASTTDRLLEHELKHRHGCVSGW